MKRRVRGRGGVSKEHSGDQDEGKNAFSQNLRMLTERDSIYAANNCYENQGIVQYCAQQSISYLKCNWTINQLTR
jgi:hypothetical protein